MKTEELKMNEIQEMQPDDGLPETAQAAPETTPEPDTAGVGLPDFSAEMMTNSEFYSPEEFRAKFQGFIEFLENPATAANCAGEIISAGRNLTADKLYNAASRYKWLNWIIDRRAALTAECLQVAVFVAVESNLIIQNWTGLNLFERLKIWLKNKAQQQKQLKKSRRSLFGWAFSARPEPEKAIEPENLQKD